MKYGQKHIFKVLLCVLISRPLCARTCAQFRGNIAPSPKNWRIWYRGITATAKHIFAVKEQLLPALPWSPRLYPAASISSEFWGSWIRVKKLNFIGNFPKNFDFFRQFHKQNNRFFRANFRIFTGNFTKMFNFSRQISVKFRLFRQIHKKIRFSRKNWLFRPTAISGQIILFLFQSHHFRTYFLYIVRYNNILRPVHDPHDPPLRPTLRPPRPPRPNIWGVASSDMTGTWKPNKRTAVSIVLKNSCSYCYRKHLFLLFSKTAVFVNICYESSGKQLSQGAEPTNEPPRLTIISNLLVFSNLLIPTVMHIMD